MNLRKYTQLPWLTFQLRPRQNCTNMLRLPPYNLNERRTFSNLAILMSHCIHLSGSVFHISVWGFAEMLKVGKLWAHTARLRMSKKTNVFSKWLFDIDDVSISMFVTECTDIIVYTSTALVRVDFLVFLYLSFKDFSHSLRCVTYNFIAARASSTEECSPD